MSGTNLGYWNIDSTNVSPTGITIDPTGASQSIWIVDVSKDRVYEYADARSWVSGNRKGTFFALVPGNTSPQDIADPDGSLRMMAADLTLGVDETAAGGSGTNTGSLASAVWSSSAVASHAWLEAPVLEQRRAETAWTMLQPNTALDRLLVGERVGTETGHEKAGLSVFTNKTIRAGDQVKEDLLALLAGRTGPDWQAAADLLLADLGRLQTLAGGK